MIDFETPVLAVLDKFITDLNTVFTLTSISEDPAFQPMNETDLANDGRMFIKIIENPTEYGGGTAGIGEVSMQFTWEFTHQFLWPTGDTIQRTKIHYANVLAKLLTAGSPRYLGHWIHYKGCSFSDFPATEQVERYATNTTTFAVEIVSAA